MFSNVKTKTNPNFAVKLSERRDHSAVYLMNHIYQISVLFNTLIECIDFIDSVNIMEKVRSSQTAILVPN